MPSASQLVEQYFLEMRWRCLSLAADLDRIDRAEGGRQILSTDPRLGSLREALKVLLQNEPDRAARVQLVFSDMSPPPNATGSGKTKMEDGE